MPIVRIRALPQQDGVDVDLALAVEPGNVWVRYDEVQPGELA
jgi:hypothetical protein